MAENDFNVDVSPHMSFYKTWQRQPYALETALSEFVDNSIQSFLDNRSALKKNNVTILDIKILISKNGDKITIEDNAGGIRGEDFAKALSINSEVKHAGHSLSVYGIGMKSALIWLSNEWEIETSAINLPEKLSTEFNLDELLKKNDRNIYVAVGENDNLKEEHYTRITIRKPLRKEEKSYYEKTVFPELQEKFFKFDFLNLKIYFGKDEISETRKAFLSPNAELVYPIVDNQGYQKNQKPITWKREINITSRENGGYHATGYISIMERGAYGQPGIRLLRNNRVILGTSLHPNMPFVTKNKYAAQRLYGEIEVKGIPVNYMKTGFDGNLSSLYAALEEELKISPDIMFQVQNFRSRMRGMSRPPAPSTKKSQGTPPQGPRSPQNPPPPPPPYNGSDRIPYYKDFHDKLKDLKSEKPEYLYLFLCNMELSKDPISAYVSAWTFLEVLAANIGNPKDPKTNKRNAFHGFYNNIAKVIRGKRSPIPARIIEIHGKGNENKHHEDIYHENARQLITDFKVLTPFLVECVSNFLNKQATP